MTPPDETEPGLRDHEIALRPGQAVGRYRIEALLGGGAVGMTYRARDTRLGREVTIKEFLPSALATREANGLVVPRSNKTSDEFGRGRRHFLNEGRMLAALQLAPCVVRVLDCIEANETAYIVMEQAQGITLEHRLREGVGLSPADLDRMLWPLLESLERVHTRGFFHGNINPANIVLDALGKPTLIDFGAARTPATALYTPGYAAPEQINGGKQGPWTDIYGLAATFYHALVGHPPPSVRDRLPEDSCQPLSVLRPEGFTPAMLEGIDKGLALRMADRPQSIAQWRSILWRTGKFGGSGAATAAAAPPEAPLVTPAFRPPRPSHETDTSTPDNTKPSRPRPGPSHETNTGASSNAKPLRPRPGPSDEIDIGAPRDMKPPRPRPESSDETNTGAPSNANPSRPRPGPSDEIDMAAPRDMKPPRARSRPSDEADMGAPRASTPPRVRVGWLGLAAASALTLGGMTYFLFAIPSAGPTEATAPASQQAADVERQRAEKEAQEKVAAAATEAAAAIKRQQEEVERQRIEAERAALRKEIEAEFQRKQEAAAEAKRKAEAADPKVAQAAEANLKLSQLDRQHVQAALGRLGFDTRGIDGAFGPRTRQMIGAWQKSRNDPPTTFLTARQRDALFKDGAKAIAAFDEQQKKAAEAAKENNPFDGDYAGTANVSTGDQPVSLRVVAGKGSGQWKVDGCGTATFTLSIAPDGAASLDLKGYNLQCEPVSQHYDGEMASNTVQFTFAGSGDPTGGLTLTRQQ
jgi:serine/threonine protein kinase